MIDLSSWPGDFIDGNPCCMWPPYIQRIMAEKGLQKYARDLQGFGIPSYGLPKWLQGFGKTGWTIREDRDSLTLVPGNKWEQTNEYGNRAYLGAHIKQICEALEAWKKWQEI